MIDKLLCDEMRLDENIPLVKCHETYSELVFACMVPEEEGGLTP